MPSEAQSVTNFATSAGEAGQKEAPFKSHHRANIGAARIRACASATSTGFIVNWLSLGLAQRLVHAAYLLA
jgi:hypothetical protein